MPRCGCYTLHEVNSNFKNGLLAFLSFLKGLNDNLVVGIRLLAWIYSCKGKTLIVSSRVKVIHLNVMGTQKNVHKMEKLFTSQRS